MWELSWKISFESFNLAKLNEKLKTDIASQLMGLVIR